MKPYAKYTAQELASDDLFVRWVQHPYDEEVAAYWQQLLNHQPQLSRRLSEARSLVHQAEQSLSLPTLSDDESDTLWQRIRGSLQNIEELRTLRPEVRRFIGWWYFARAVAAAVGIVLLVGWAVYMQYSQEASRMITTTDQARLVTLPDGTRVRLYPHSQLRFTPRGFARESTVEGSVNTELTRAVWLNGSADFDVINSASQGPANAFRVHTEHLTAEATGTHFNICHTKAQTRVALQTGHLNLLLGHQQVHQLNPGETVAVAGGEIK